MISTSTSVFQSLSQSDSQEFHRCSIINKSINTISICCLTLAISRSLMNWKFHCVRIKVTYHIQLATSYWKLIRIIWKYLDSNYQLSWQPLNLKDFHFLVFRGFIFKPASKKRVSKCGKLLLSYVKRSVLQAKLLVNGIVDVKCVSHCMAHTEVQRVSLTRDELCNDV